MYFVWKIGQKLSNSHCLTPFFGLLTECPPLGVKSHTKRPPVSSCCPSIPFTVPKCRVTPPRRPTHSAACMYYCRLADGDSNDFSLSFSLTPASLPHSCLAPLQFCAQHFRPARFIILMVLLLQSWLVSKARSTFIGDWRR